MKRFLRKSVKAAAAAGDLLRRPAPGVVVLLYHRVGRRTPVEVDLPADLFDAQMAELAATGRVVSLDQALELLSSGTAPTDDRIVVTFDDGTADFADAALPVLDRHRVPAVLYLATRFIDEGMSFPDGGRPLSWSAVRDAASTGLVTIGSHTHSHILLDRAPTDDVDRELDQSIDLIGEHLGAEPRDFAYPKAVPGSPYAQAAIRLRFRSAALAGTRPNVYGSSDPYELQRSPVQVSDGMRWFRRKVAGGLVLEDRLRRLVNRRRYAEVTT